MEDRKIIEDYASKAFNLDKKQLRRQGFDLKMVGDWKIEKHLQVGSYYYSIMVVDKVFDIGLSVNTIGNIYHENGGLKVQQNYFITA